MIPRSVVLPDPEGPMIATNSPSWIARLAAERLTATSPLP